MRNSYGRLTPLAVVALLLTTTTLTAQAAGSCYVLSVGPSPSTDDPPLTIPAAFQLAATGAVLAATRPGESWDSALIGEWKARGDTLHLTWVPRWLGGSLEANFLRRGDTLLGRYSLHGHQADDGRLLWRGAAFALQFPCADPLGGKTAELKLQEVRSWQARQIADTSAAVAEGVAAFESFLRATPVHSLSLFNYLIATYACRHDGALPRSLDELRIVASTPALQPLEDRAFLDAWNHRPAYRPRPPGYDLRLAGPDGKFGTSDDLVGHMDRPLRRDRELDCLSRY